MGFTLRATLDLLPPAPTVVVAELVPAVVEWNRGPLGPLAGHPLKDPRVRVECGTSASRCGRARDRFDAVLLDVDNGPAAFTRRQRGALRRRRACRGAGSAQTRRRAGGLVRVGGSPVRTAPPLRRLHRAGRARARAPEKRRPAPHHLSRLRAGGLITSRFPARSSSHAITRTTQSPYIGAAGATRVHILGGSKRNIRSWRRNGIRRWSRTCATAGRRRPGSTCRCSSKKCWRRSRSERASAAWTRRSAGAATRERSLERLAPAGRLLGLDVDPIRAAEDRGAPAPPWRGGAVPDRAAEQLRRPAMRRSTRPGGRRRDFAFADLGVSSMQVDDPARGFSFKVDGPLDMRMNPARGRLGRAVAERRRSDALARALEQDADEPHAADIASALSARRGSRSPRRPRWPTPCAPRSTGRVRGRRSRAGGPARLPGAADRGQRRVRRTRRAAAEPARLPPPADAPRCSRSTPARTAA